jgi:phosphoribosylanthranilate isomerase
VSGRVGLKICGVTHVDDLRACRDEGADAVGINFWSGSKRHVSLRDAARMLDVVRGEGELPLVVGVFVDPAPGELSEIVEAVGVQIVQLHGDVPGAAYAALGRPWIQVIRGPRPLARLSVSQPRPQWVLLDASVPGYGGQGVQLDWAWAHDAVAALSAHDVWLAGGITPQNAAEATATVGPAGIDVASGAEREGDARRKDPAKIAALRRICHNPGA